MHFLQSRSLLQRLQPHSSSRCRSCPHTHLRTTQQQDRIRLRHHHTMQASNGTEASTVHPDTASSSSSSNSSSTTSADTTCTVSYRGASFNAPKGSKLRSAMLLNGVSPHNGRAQLINCRGLGTCGTCAVEIEGKVSPPAWTSAEQLRLNFPPHRAPNNQKLRLACQVTCEGPELQVVKRDRFWGQGDNILGPAQPEEYSLPLGELEFLLDSNRQQQQQQQQQQQRQHQK